MAMARERLVGAAVTFAILAGVGLATASTFHLAGALAFPVIDGAAGLVVGGILGTAVAAGRPITSVAFGTGAALVGTILVAIAPDELQPTAGFFPMVATQVGGGIAAARLLQRFLGTDTHQIGFRSEEAIELDRRFEREWAIAAIGVFLLPAILFVIAIKSGCAMCP